MANRPMIIALGQPHPLLDQRPMTEGVLLTITPDYFGIIAGYTHPTLSEITAHQRGPVDIGLAPGGDHTLFFIMRVGNVWCDMPYALGILPEDQRNVLPDRRLDWGYLLHMELVDRASNMVVAMRAFTVTPTFSALLGQQIDRLRDNLPQFTKDKHLAEVAAFYRRFDQSSLPQAALIIEQAGKSFVES